MRKVFFSVLFLIITASVYGQNRTLIKGKIIDSLTKTPLELATVDIVDVKDTSLLAYTLSTKSGEFILRGLPVKKRLRIIIYFVSYKSFKTSFTLQQGEIKNLGTISLNQKSLDEVVINGYTPPVTIKKDSIEFDARAFKTRPNAVLEDLLRKLPGVQVNYDGSILVNGKSVSKLLIDGKQFFGNDPTVATKNLDADIVAKIQIYDDRENDPDTLISETQVNKIINIKLKRAIKKSLLGKVYAGGGTNGRYESGGLLNMFRDTIQLSLIGLSNNLNSTGFSRDEFNSLGGFSRGGGDVLNNGTLAAGGNYNGISQITSGGFNFNADYGKKLKVNLLYFYAQKSNVTNTSSYVQNFIPDTALFSKANSERVANNYNNTISALVEWKPDDATTIRYAPIFNFSGFNNTSSSLSNTYTNFGNVNTNSANGSTNGTGDRFQQDFYYHYKFKKKGESITISNNVVINPGNNNQYNNNTLISYTPIVPSDTLHQYISDPVVNTAVSVSASYRYPVTKKLTATMLISDSYSNNGENLLKYNLDPQTGRYDLLLQDQSTSFKRKQWTEGVAPGITYHLTPSVSIITSLNTQWQNIGNYFITGLSIKQNYFYLLPSLRVDAGKFSFSYNTYVSQPAIMNLQPITTIYSPLYSFTGNPSLKPTTNNVGGVSFYDYIPESQVGISFNGSYSVSQNSVIRAETFNSSDVQTAYPLNMNGQANLVASVGFSKRFKKINDWQISLNSGLYENYYKNAFMINKTPSYQNAYYQAVSQGFSVNWNDKVDLYSSFNLNYEYADYSDKTYVDIKNTIYSMNNQLDMRLPLRLVWTINQNYSYNSQISAGFPKATDLLSTSLALQMFKKDRGQLKFSVYDIFNKSASVYRSTWNDNIYQSQTQVLQRYFLLTYMYKFNISNSK